MEVIIPILIELLPVLLPIIMDCIDKPDDGRERLREFADNLSKVSFKAGKPLEFAIGQGLACVARQPDAQFKASVAGLRKAGDAAVAGLKRATPEIEEPVGPEINT